MMYGIMEVGGHYVGPRVAATLGVVEDHVSSPCHLDGGKPVQDRPFEGPEGALDRDGVLVPNIGELVLVVGGRRPAAAPCDADQALGEDPEVVGDMAHVSGDGPVQIPAHRRAIRRANRVPEPVGHAGHRPESLVGRQLPGEAALTTRLSPGVDPPSVHGPILADLRTATRRAYGRPRKPGRAQSGRPSAAPGPGEGGVRRSSGSA